MQLASLRTLAAFAQLQVLSMTDADLAGVSLQLFNYRYLHAFLEPAIAYQITLAFLVINKTDYMAPSQQETVEVEKIKKFLGSIPASANSTQTNVTFDSKRDSTEVWWSQLASELPSALPVLR